MAASTTCAAFCVRTAGASACKDCGSGPSSALCCQASVGKRQPRRPGSRRLLPNHRAMRCGSFAFNSRAPRAENIRSAPHRIAVGGKGRAQLLLAAMCGRCEGQSALSSGNSADRPSAPHQQRARNQQAVGNVFRRLRRNQGLKLIRLRHRLYERRGQCALWHRMAFATLRAPPGSRSH